MSRHMGVVIVGSAKSLNKLYDAAETRSHWRDMGEEELLDVAFVTTEPEKLPGITNERPPANIEPIVELCYALKGRSEGKARCVHCNYDNHYNGFVLKYPDGSRRLVGKDCGMKLYGAVFEHFEKDFNAAKDLAGYFRRRRAAVAAAPALLSGLAEMIKHPALPAFSLARQQFRATMPRLYDALAHVAHGAKQLVISEKVRNFKEEERRETALEQMDQRDRQRSGYLNKKGKLAHVWQSIPKPLGPLAGAPFFLPDDSPAVVLRRIQSNLTDQLKALDRDNLTTKQMQGGLKNVGGLLAEIEQEFDRLSALFDAFELTNLQRISQWAAYKQLEYDHGASYSADMGVIIRRLDGEKSEARFPAGYSVPSRAFLDAYRVRSDPHNLAKAA